ncbi:cytochrome P450 [Camillea tinctor]|nr:cytochrome P450 [Camillea tinctor]
MTSLYVSLLAVLAVLIGSRLLINWLKLRKAPGPILAGATDLWRAYQQYRGRLREKLVELHSQYGPIVRYGVRSVSISDPEVINVVYGSRAGFITADSYKVLIGIQNGKEVPSLVSTADEARHGALRRSVANAFTPTASLDYESYIDETLTEFLDILSKKTQEPFDLAALILYYTIDSAGRFSFGEPLGCLAAESDVGGSIQLIRDRFNHWGHWSSLPQLERLVYRNPVAMRAKRAPSSMAAAAVTKLRSRTEKHDAINDNKTDLLQRFLEASKAHPQTLDTAGVVGMLMSTISGAGDTTATTIAATLYYLLRNAPALRALRAELEAHPPDTARLPYLDAVLKESMRVFPTPTWPMERRVPAPGATIAGVRFPEGTSVGCLPSAVHKNEAVFGDDAGRFRPERWLEGTGEEGGERRRRMEAAMMGFSRGRRSCLGQNIALLQMRKVVAAVVMRFDLSLVRPEAPLEADFSPAVACLKPLYVRCRPRQR